MNRNDTIRKIILVINFRCGNIKYTNKQKAVNKMIDLEYLLRDELDKTFRQYDLARRDLIDSLTLKQYRLWTKAMRRVKRSRSNIIDYNSLDFTKISKNIKKLRLFNLMIIAYSEYTVIINRTNFRIVA